MIHPTEVPQLAKMLRAKEIIKKIAEGRYHCVQHKIIEHSDGGIKEECSAYIADIGWTPDLPTWEEIIQDLQAKKEDKWKN